jgi:hypothetical protein
MATAGIVLGWIGIAAGIAFWWMMMSVRSAAALGRASDLVPWHDACDAGEG